MLDLNQQPWDLKTVVLHTELSLFFYVSSPHVFIFQFLALDFKMHLQPQLDLNQQSQDLKSLHLTLSYQIYPVFRDIFLTSRELLLLFYRKMNLLFCVISNVTLRFLLGGEQDLYPVFSLRIHSNVSYYPHPTGPASHSVCK